MMLNETKATNSVNNTFCVNPATRYPIKQALATTKEFEWLHDKDDYTLPL